ncbi:14 kDa proline-rich protein DC2.15-like [Dioscorea cayenensis subsp. rotundata]|uniref:14 kDa proline-rich protein DC2.15-like n=1 Tax=Dioscorea cayennensis subsp. rotundata TaxID=55577 RepID=A0AB40BKK5_DIOCR|nr:14 kDa proline-rich protein DC2.15-like [Dioscorea cayenensis subsp. rotundata]
MAYKTNATASFALFLTIFFFFFTLSSSWPRPASPPPPPPPCDDDNKLCPIDTLKLGVCIDVLNGLLNVTIGKPPKEPCCPLLGGLLDVEAAVCLCTAIKADILGIHLNIPIDLSLLLNYCGKGVPKGFKCP